MYATKEYYENKISNLEYKIKEVKSFIEEMQMIKYNASSEYIMEEILKIVEDN